MKELAAGDKEETQSGRRESENYGDSEEHRQRVTHLFVGCTLHKFSILTEIVQSLHHGRIVYGLLCAY
jgi:Na+-translocating ferredoxin:NAD+ oxidoreductase RnfD subunit